MHKNTHCLLLEAFYTGSHKKWADELVSHSMLRWDLLHLPGRHWKWRMHGAALSFAQSIEKMKTPIDVLVTSDMLDLLALNGLSKTIQSVPKVLYMHENQLTYPWSETDQDVVTGRNHHYAFINFTSMICADEIWFNSNFHKTAWFDELPRYLKMFPDQRPSSAIPTLIKKSRVLPIGLDLTNRSAAKKNHSVPRLVWNHRWEYDKNPEAFFAALHRLKQEGISFELIVLGEKTQQSPKVFEDMKAKLENETIHWGYCESADDYWKWLQHADILPVTSKQDFFGISAVEGIAAGCIPLLPKRLAFPEHIPPNVSQQFLYDTNDDFYNKLKSFILNFKKVDTSTLQQFVQSKYDWKQIAPAVDSRLNEIIAERNNK